LRSRIQRQSDDTGSASQTSFPSAAARAPMARSRISTERNCSTKRFQIGIGGSGDEGYSSLNERFWSSSTPSSVTWPMNG